MTVGRILIKNIGLRRPMHKKENPHLSGILMVHQTKLKIDAFAFMLCTANTVRDVPEDLLKDDEAGRVLQFMALKDNAQKFAHTTRKKEDCAPDGWEHDHNMENIAFGWEHDKQLEFPC